MDLRDPGWYFFRGDFEVCGFQRHHSSLNMITTARPLGHGQAIQSGMQRFESLHQKLATLPAQAAWDHCYVSKIFLEKTSWYPSLGDWIFTWLKLGATFPSPWISVIPEGLEPFGRPSATAPWRVPAVAAERDAAGQWPTNVGGHATWKCVALVFFAWHQ